MKIKEIWVGSAALALLATTSGCDWMPGRPVRQDIPPEQARAVEFQTLFRTNCLACHSDGTTYSAARPMNDPVYLAFIGSDNMQRIIEEGVADTSMPAFAKAHGGDLSDDQISVLVEGIMKWSNPDKVPEATMPPYSAELGDVAAGEQAYGVYCAHCHGADGRGGEHGDDILNPAFLGLVSDQDLRTTVVVGREDLGMPNWTDYVEDRVMSDQEISDLVAWMASHRTSPSLSTPPAAPAPEPESEPESTNDNSSSDHE